MTAPRRAQGDFLPDEDFVDGLTGFGLLLDRHAALVEGFAREAGEGPALVPDEHPALLLMLGLVALRRAAGDTVAAARSAERVEAPSRDAPEGDGRGLLR